MKGGFSIRRPSGTINLGKYDSDLKKQISVGYGYGWNVAEERTFSHTGSDGTGAWVDPSQDLIVLVFTQTPRGQNPRVKFLELVRAAILE